MCPRRPRVRPRRCTKLQQTIGKRSSKTVETNPLKVKLRPRLILKQSSKKLHLQHTQHQPQVAFSWTLELAQLSRLHPNQRQRSLLRKSKRNQLAWKRMELKSKRRRKKRLRLRSRPGLRNKNANAKKSLKPKRKSERRKNPRRRSTLKSFHANCRRKFRSEPRKENCSRCNEGTKLTGQSLMRLFSSATKNHSQNRIQKSYYRTSNTRN